MYNRFHCDDWKTVEEVRHTLSLMIGFSSGHRFAHYTNKGEILLVLQIRRHFKRFSVVCPRYSMYIDNRTCRYFTFNASLLITKSKIEIKRVLSAT